MAKASALLDRTRAERASLRARSGVSVGTRLTRIAIADAVILVAAMVIGWIIPLGIGGALLVMGALIAATLLFAMSPGVPVVNVEKLPETPLKLLPLRTEQWLATQRANLPSQAQSLVDGIGNRLETLAPQLATLNENEPVTGEIRKLVSEQLPELVNGYNRVPQPLRAVARNGRTPDQQLSDGLKVIADEIAEMTARLAEGDLDQLQTRGRYLEMKYRDDAIEG
jgi:hypothetical protein